MAVSNNDGDAPRIIVSLTTFPGRINIVYKALYSIMNQTVKPDMIILWLSRDQFRDIQLPKELTDLSQLGLTIKWVDGDIRSYKKLVPALMEYPDDIIITADDDLYYPIYWIESLIKSYKKYPNDIHSHLITRLSREGDKVIYQNRSRSMSGEASYYNKLLGGSGTLYPPHSLNEKVTDIRLFTKLAPTSDDIWFWSMAVLNRHKIRWIENGMPDIFCVEKSQETDCLWKVNDNEANVFEKHLNDVIRYFDLMDILESD
ncbi:MAG: hypothetical protein Q4D29_08010 [Lachnospiraceae bacterium]|nr:hypothetical protein [Lachnospiraceae bacterium]